MASAYLTSTNDAAIAGDWWTDLARLKKSALACNSPVHQLAMSPGDADIILFSDSSSSTQADVRNHELTRRFGNKVFVYSTRDQDVPILPGVYACAEKRWYLPDHMRAGHYLKVMDHDWIQLSPLQHQSQYLFSFCGAFDTHPLRSRIAKLVSTRGFVRDTSNDEGRGFGKTADTYQRWAAEYFETIRQTMFVLCPRGVAPSSYRIFEAMKAGRVPVIIADTWVPPLGPNWADFSLQVPEAQLEEVPDILERLAKRAPEMGVRARQAWEDWFSEEQAFQTIVTWCLQVQEARRNQGSLRSYLPLLQLARPIALRHVVLPAAKKAVLTRMGRS